MIYTLILDIIRRNAKVLKISKRAADSELEEKGYLPVERCNIYRLCRNHAEKATKIINLAEDGKYGFCDDDWTYEEDDYTINCGRCKREVYEYYSYITKDYWENNQIIEHKKEALLKEYEEYIGEEKFIDLCRDCKNYINTIYS